jgi:hypothetical protein
MKSKARWLRRHAAKIEKVKETSPKKIRLLGRSGRFLATIHLAQAERYVRQLRATWCDGRGAIRFIFFIGDDSPESVRAGNFTAARELTLRNYQGQSTTILEPLGRELCGCIIIERDGGTRADQRCRFCRGTGVIAADAHCASFKHIDERDAHLYRLSVTDTISGRTPPPEP